MNKPKFLSYDEWLKENWELDDGEDEHMEECPKCDGRGERDCTCDKCGDEHEEECPQCDGMGEISIAPRIYEEQKKADELRWKKYNEQFK